MPDTGGGLPLKKILIYTMYFAPEPMGIAPMATDLASGLAKRGWQVSVIAGMPKLPAWEPYDGYRGKWLVRAGNVWHTWVYIPPKPAAGQMAAWRRVLHDSSIAASGFPAALATGRPDLILSITPPLQLAAAAIALKKWWRCPLVNWVQDIVPDAALNVGMMREGMALELGRRLERFVYRHADTLAVISEGMKANLARKGVPEAKLTLATNWADAEPFAVPSRSDAVREKWGVGREDFVMVYGGSFAAKQVLENVVRAMKLLEPQRDIWLFLTGDGIRKAALLREIQALGAPRITFLGLVGTAEYAQTLRAADLLVLNQSRDLIDALTPSKLLTYWLAARPVIAAVNENSEAALLVRACGGGKVVEPENPERFAAAVLELRARPEQMRAMGEAGERFVSEHYSKETVLSRFAEFLESRIPAAAR